MAVDHAGDHGQAVAVDDLGHGAGRARVAGRRVAGRVGPYRGDAPVAHHHVGALELAIPHVDQAAPEGHRSHGDQRKAG